MGIKFPTPWKTPIIKFPPPRDGKGVKCPGYARGGGHVEASIWPIHYLTLLMQANIKNRKKLQLIQTWFEMSWLSSHYFTFHWKLLVLVSRIQKSGTWDNSFGEAERHISVRPTEMTRPVTVDHLQSWSRIAWIFRSDQTEMVRSIWWTNRNFRNFGLNGKHP